MPYPTTEEAAIYKNKFKQFEVECFIRLDYPVFSGYVSDNFDGAELNPDLWHSFNPSWGRLEVTGGEVIFGTSSPGITESWFVTKENIWFPRSTDNDWFMQTRVRTDTINGFGTFIDVISLEQYRPLFRIEVNAGGTAVQMPAPTDVITLGPDLTYNTYRLEYHASTKEYELFIDQESGSGFVSLGTMSAVNYRADYMVFGNSGVRQGFLSDWSVLRVDYLIVSGTPEDFNVPEWAGPQYLYDQLQYQNELWARLPSVIRGSINVDKENESDTLDLDLVNYTWLDKGSPESRIYTRFSFLNRFIRVISRVNNGIDWTPWRQIFLGNCDEKQIEQRPDGSVVLTLRARDWVRKRLEETKVVRAYSDYGLPVDGLFMNMTVAQIVQDIAQNVCGLPYSAVYIDETPENTPRTYNIAGRSASEAIAELMGGLGLTWWVNYENGQVVIEPWPFGTDTPQYYLRTDEEVESINWGQSAFESLSQIEIGISNTEFQNGGFANAWPPAPVMFHGRVDFVDIITVQTSGQQDRGLIGRKIFMGRIRKLGSLRVTMKAQDWVSHNLEIGVEDDTYLGIRRSDGPFIIDGWTHSWEGNNDFTTELSLVSQHPDNVLRDMQTGHI